MPVQLNPYLFLAGSARDALAFYHEVLGGELEIVTFGQAGMATDPQDEDLVMHGELRTPDGLVLMAADTPSGHPPPTGSAIAISLSGDDEDRLLAIWARLAEEAAVELPIERAPWGDMFGQLVDRFGTTWMISIGEP